jgi:4-hydroxy-tetrahydrodipicolinate synthase
MTEMSRPWRSWQDLQRTRELLFEYQPLMAALYSLPNPIVVKAALRLLGLPAGHVRRPLLDMEESEAQDLRALMDHMGVMAKYGQG